MSSDDRDGSRRAEELVTDPEDYNRTQRFKEIHEARQRVSEHISEMDIPKTGGSTYNLAEGTRLAHLVSLYIMELEPLIVQSEIDDGDLVSGSVDGDSLLQFAARLGVKPGEGSAPETPAPQESIHYFSAANRFYAKVGMDLELSEDEGDAGFDYSDILEEGPPGGSEPKIEADGGPDAEDSDQ
jgi:hypothetical protein